VSQLLIQRKSNQIQADEIAPRIVGILDSRRRNILQYHSCAA